MQREERGYHPTATDEAGGALQHPEQQQCVQGVEQNVDIVRPGGIQTEHRGVERVRDPGDRVPVGRIARGQRPLDGGPVQAGFDVEVVGDVVGVIVIGEGLPVDGIVNSDNGNFQQDTEKNHLCEGRSEPAWGAGLLRRLQINRRHTSPLPAAAVYAVAPTLASGISRTQAASKLQNGTLRREGGGSQTRLTADRIQPVLSAGMPICSRASCAVSSAKRLFCMSLSYPGVKDFAQYSTGVA
jgi:hypothetical protein